MLGISSSFRPSSTLTSPRPDPEQSPRPDRLQTKLKSNNNNIDVASVELEKSIQSAEVIPADRKKRDSKLSFLAYDRYTERQLSKLFLFPSRGKKVMTIRAPRGPDLDAKGFKVPRSVGTLG